MHFYVFVLHLRIEWKDFVTTLVMVVRGVTKFILFKLRLFIFVSSSRRSVFPFGELREYISTNSCSVNQNISTMHMVYPSDCENSIASLFDSFMSTAKLLLCEIDV